MLQKFYGRLWESLHKGYGFDEIGQCLLCFCSILVLMLLLLENRFLTVLTGMIASALLICIYYRMFSKNIDKRAAENNGYLYFCRKIRRIYLHAKRSCYRRKKWGYSAVRSCGLHICILAQAKECSEAGIAMVHLVQCHMDYPPKTF